MPKVAMSTERGRGQLITCSSVALPTQRRQATTILRRRGKADRRGGLRLPVAVQGPVERVFEANLRRRAAS